MNSGAESNKRDAIAAIVKTIPFARPVYLWLRDSLRRVARAVRVVRLTISKMLVPSGYYVQIQPKYTRMHPDVVDDQKKYDALHDWPDMRDGARVLSARMLLRQAALCDAGDYAELGTYRGNFARIIYRHKAAGTMLYCFDTFEGFDERDVAAERSASGVNTFAGNFSDTSIDVVARNIVATGGAPDLELRQGFFPDTYVGLEDKAWRFVMLDADLYEPIKSGLETFWPRLVPGGVLMIDDCVDSYYAGVQLAVDEFFGPLGIFPTPLPDCSGTVVVIKQRM